MAKVDGEEIDFSSESDPEELDLDEINDIRVDEKDL